MAAVQEMMIQAFRHQQAGNLREAEQLYRRVLETEPTHVYALNNLGMLAKETGRTEEAVVLLRQAVALQPAVTQFHSNLAMAYHAVQDLHAAAAEYREAMRLRPSPGALAHLGQLLVEIGEFDEAMALGRQALQMQPGFVPAYGLLGEMVAQRQNALTPDDVCQMQALLESTDLSAPDAAILYYRLGAYWDAQGDYDEAFRCYHQANEVRRETFRREGQSFDRQKQREQTDGLMAAFTPDFFRQVRAYAHDSERPVFVLGMVRSGTTLTEQILASHPQIFGCGELPDIQKIAGSFYPACLARGVDRAAAQGYAEQYLQQLARHSRSSAVRVVDKMPHNYRHLGLIAALFPRARVVHCRRNPLDVCLSAYFQSFGVLAYATNLADIGFFYCEYARLMEYWSRVVPIRMHEVVYEDMVANQERVSRELIAFCGLAWDEACLKYYQLARPVHTASKAQVRQPIYSRSVARWKRYEQYLQPLRDELARGGVTS
jgi:tetratricopeptide (TPR) repeat protein